MGWCVAGWLGWRAGGTTLPWCLENDAPAPPHTQTHIATLWTPSPPLFHAQAHTAAPSVVPVPPRWQLCLTSKWVRRWQRRWEQHSGQPHSVCLLHSMRCVVCLLRLCWWLWVVLLGCVCLDPASFRSPCKGTLSFQLASCMPPACVHLLCVRAPPHWQTATYWGDTLAAWKSSRQQLSAVLCPFWQHTLQTSAACAWYGAAPGAHTRCCQHLSALFQSVRTCEWRVSICLKHTKARHTYEYALACSLLAMHVCACAWLPPAIDAATACALIYIYTRYVCHCSNLASYQVIMLKCMHVCVSYVRAPVCVC